MKDASKESLECVPFPWTLFISQKYCAFVQLYHYMPETEELHAIIIKKHLLLVDVKQRDVLEEQAKTKEDVPVRGIEPRPPR